MVHNRTCEGDWFMINGSQNAKIFTVHGIPRDFWNKEAEYLRLGVTWPK